MSQHTSHHMNQCMYALVCYVDYRKEVTIEIMDIFQSREKALEYFNSHTEPPKKVEECDKCLERLGLCEACEELMEDIDFADYLTRLQTVACQDCKNLLKSDCNCKFKEEYVFLMGDVIKRGCGNGKDKYNNVVGLVKVELH